MISRKVINILAYRNTSPSKINIFKGGPVRFAVNLDSSINLDGCTSLRLDLRISAIDESSILASSAISNPSGSAFDFDFTTGETNHSYATIWLVLSAFFPGETSEEDNLDPLFISEINLVSHNASLLAPQPPNTAVALTQDSADSLYYPLNPELPIKLPVYTVAEGPNQIPAAALYEYHRCFVSDSSISTFNSVLIGGGATKVPVWSDGTNWIIG